VESVALHVTGGDAVVPELAAAVRIEPGEVLVWRDLLHDGPVPGGLDPFELATVRATHLAGRGWVDEQSALDGMIARDAQLDTAIFLDGEVVLWFENDLCDALQLAQITDRLAGHPRVSLVDLPHPPRGDLRAAFEARRPLDPDGAAFAALRSPDPNAWFDVPGFERLLEELPDSRSGLSRLEQEIIDALASGPLTPEDLFRAVATREQPPWIGDSPLWAVADDLAPLIRRSDGKYALTGEDLSNNRERWLGGVRLGPGSPRWAWDASTRAVVELPPA
jgi:hypothetical protein